MGKTLLVTGLMLAVAYNANGQAINIDFSFIGFDGPSAEYGGVAAQPGPWNRILGGSGSGLLSTTGAATAAAVSAELWGGESLDVPTSNEDERLMMSTAITFGFGRNSCRVLDLQPGWYDVYAYIWGGPGFANADFGIFSPQSQHAFATNLSLPWPGQQVKGITYLKARLFTSGPITMGYGETGMRVAPLSGIQIVPVPSPGVALLPLAALAVTRRRR